MQTFVDCFKTIINITMKVYDEETPHNMSMLPVPKSFLCAQFMHFLTFGFLLHMSTNTLFLYLLMQFELQLVRYIMAKIGIIL